MLATAWEGRVVHRIPIEWPQFLTAILFSAAHLGNLGELPAGYVAFQLLYTFVGALISGLARQWTGSLLYGLGTHALVNWIAWVTS